jgi:ABC-type nickel/cobalt efflux system permease component RcnA
MRVAVIFCLALAAVWTFYLIADFGAVAAWAVETQRDFQNRMATSILGLKTGTPGAYFALLSAAAAYGFVHALGPGHGKYLVGGVGLGTSISAFRLTGLAIASSLAQALWAIVLVYGGFFLIEASARQMTTLAEDILAPVSYIAIACVGAVLVWRGMRSLRATQSTQSVETDCGCHAHGPAPDQVARVTSFREAVVLVLSIAVRPCTGAVFLLVIAWQMDIHLAGALAVLVMGLGTAALTSLVALSSISARHMTFTSANALAGLHIALPVLQVSAGVLIALISLSLLRLTG